MAEAALILAVRSSVAVLRLRSPVVAAVLKPTKNKVPEEPNCHQATKRSRGQFPHPPPHHRVIDRGTKRKRVGAMRNSVRCAGQSAASLAVAAGCLRLASAG